MYFEKQLLKINHQKLLYETLLYNTSSLFKISKLIKYFDIASKPKKVY